MDDKIQAGKKKQILFFAKSTWVFFLFVWVSSKFVL